jgi:hypothetical protein
MAAMGFFGFNAIIEFAANVIDDRIVRLIEWQT